MKYVGLSALSYAGLQLILGRLGPLDPLPLALASEEARALLATSGVTGGGLPHLFRLCAAAVLGYSALLNGTIAVLFKLRRGTALLGKDRERGTIPWWSYALFFPFHGPTYAYTHFHTLHGTMRPPYAAGEEGAGTKEADRVTVPVASEVQSGWWVGGCYAHRLGKQWAGVVDLTTEFPERCRPHTARYLCLPTWDGVPCSPVQLEEAAAFCLEAREAWTRERGGAGGPPQVLVHCAHGRGRSTTVMCAALVKAGAFATYEEALEEGIRPGRPCCKLNKMMRASLAEWQWLYVETKKGN